MVRLGVNIKTKKIEKHLFFYWVMSENHSDSCLCIILRENTFQFGATNWVEDFNSTTLESSVYTGESEARALPSSWPHVELVQNLAREPALVRSTTELHAQAQGASLCSSITETACHHSSFLGHSVPSLPHSVCACTHVCLSCMVICKYMYVPVFVCMCVDVWQGCGLCSACQAAWLDNRKGW